MNLTNKWRYRILDNYIVLRQHTGRMWRKALIIESLGREDMLTHFSLFSGIGGIDLAAEWAGFTTIGQCEFADYPTKVLEKHWPDVPRWRDIRDVTADSFKERTGLRTVDFISGGFPCQPFSVAGNQKGKEDDRYLWPEMLRIIRELKPRWVLGENVPGILRIAGDDICKDLERQGYDVGIFNFEAAAIGALHRRERIFFVANCNSEWKLQSEGIKQIIGRWSCDKGCIMADPKNGNEGLPCRTITPDAEFRICCETTTHPNNKGLQVTRHEPRINKIPTENRIELSDWWTTEPDVGRVAHGIPSRVDRLKCLGNAVVPQQVYPILQAIADIENNM